MRKFQVAALILTSLLLAAASAAQLRQVAIIDIPGRPGFSSVALAGKYVVMAHTAADTVDVFDPARRRVLEQIKGLSAPRGIAVDEKSGLVYVANSGNDTISVITSKDWKIDHTIQLKSSPDALLLVPERETLYVTNWHDQSISAVNLAQNESVQTASVNGIPEDMAYDPDQNQLFVSTQGNSGIVVLNADNSVAHRYTLTASQPTGLAFDRAGKKLYVAVRAAVLALNPADGAEIARVPSPAGVDSLWYDDATHSVYAAAENGSVNMIKADASAGRYYSEDEMRTSVKGHTLAFDAARSFVYMPGGREGRSKLIILKRVENAQQSVNTAAQPAGNSTVAQQH